ncbi:MAG: glycosyltransferase [Phycisphaeraceae bacterium]|nr:glycosyltransferase [Phycisphaeraceae bacterium]
MKILHVLSKIDPSSGGPVTALGGLTSAEKAIGLDVRVMSTRDPTRANPALIERLRSLEIEVKTLEDAHGPLLRHAQIGPTLQAMIGDAQVVHIHGVWEEAQHQAARISRRLNVPYIVRPCGMLDPWSLAQSRLRKKLFMALRVRTNLQHAAAMHFTSETERDNTRPLRLRPPSIVEPNGVDLKEFAQLPAKGSFRRRYPQLGDHPLVVFMSRLHVKKGLDHLIPAIAKAELNDCRLALVGPDNFGYRATVESMVREHNLQDRVVFTGVLHGRQRVEALADADLFVLPSYQENFGIAVVEALAAGTPVVISDQVNIHDRISAAGVGGVVPMDVDKLAAEIRRWMTDDTLRRTAAEKARPFVWENYDWSAIAHRWVRHYEELIAGRI